MKTALITGSAKLIGKAIAFHLAEKGWNLAIHYNNSEDEAVKLYNKLSAKYPKQEFNIFQADLQNPLAAERLIPEVNRVMPSLCLLINNASVFEKAPLLASPFDLIERTMQVNYIAPILLSRDFGRLINEGNIINITNNRIIGNKADYTAYTLSKNGLWDLTKMTALEFAPNIRVNSITLGTLIPSEGEKADKIAEKNAKLKDVDCTEALQTIDFILENGHLTGQQIFCDGAK